MDEDTQQPALIGLDGIAEFYRKPPNTIYSWKRRGKFGPPDAEVAGKAIWYRDRFRDPGDDRNIDLGERPPLPRLMGIADVAKAFAVKVGAVEKWSLRTRDSGDTTPRPPEPRWVISYTPIWLPEDWRPFAEATHRPYDPPPEQGGGTK
ncbi:hypothetical protein F5972_08010 [Microbispora cellulosiformans]|uniref:Uncharacterized protein n=1 Tax=Microbispora cellulosiformans TaxID=2614688 RepID=A0A5J5K4S8_9ACTN|nr:hypothetical protein [Microbispora cellulosiformans]KAA9379591.1 hypothetical protein F5972_08010 [Microbispora cellulosiformans]